MGYITQAQFIRRFNEQHREQFNPVFFNRDNQDIMDCVKKVILSCEKDKYFTLKVLEMREIYDYEEIYNTLRAYVESRKGKKTVDNPFDYIDIKDSDIMLLEVKYFVRHNGTEKQELYDEETGQKKTLDVKDPYDVLTVLIALPRFVRKYYFRLSGNYYTSVFQIVDGSTYNNSQTNTGSNRKAECNTFKTLFMPVRIYKRFKDLTDYTTKRTIRTIIYGSNIFNNFIDCMYYILANYGMYGTMDFLDIRCVWVNNYPTENPELYNFQKHNLFITVPKYCMQDPMVQSLVATIYDAIGKETSQNDVYNIRFWIRNLGAAYKGGNQMDKGLFVLDSIDSIYDIITQEQLHLPEEYKQNIYQILRWIMREFSYLKNKDNIDVTLKRVRIAEYIAAVYANKISKGIHRISDAGKRVTLNSIIKAIRTDPMYVLNNISVMSNLVSYRDLVNDMDSTVALKYTYKGISGLGEDGTSIQKNYRYVDPSHAGILDLDASSASDPGMSGMICPMTNMYNSSFTQYEEPNNWENDYKHYQTEWFQQQRPGVVKPFTFDPEFNRPDPDYLTLRQKIVEEQLQIDKINCPFYNIYDESIDYSASAARIKAKLEADEEAARQQQSLFTIREDDDYE